VLGYAAAVVAVAIWAGWIVLVRGTAATLSPADVAALRYGGPALLLAPVWLRRGVAPAGVAPLRLAAMVLGWGAPFAWFAARGLRDADVGLFAALAPGAMPLWAALIAAVALGARFGRAALAGLGLIAAAAALALWSAPAPALAGAPWVTAAAIGWAAYTVAFRGAGLTPVEATAIVGFWSTLMLVPVALSGGLTLHTLPLPALATQFALHGVVSGVVSVAAFALAIRELGAARAAGFAALVPGLAALLGWVVLGEAPGAGTAAALACATLGVALLNRPR